LRKNYFKLQQELAHMIFAALMSKLSVEEAHDISHHVGILMSEAESPLMKDLYQAAEVFSVWLDDTDVRLTDSEYDRLMTDKIKTWAELNLHKST
jgi:hypothetical protein